MQHIFGVLGFQNAGRDEGAGNHSAELSKMPNLSGDEGSGDSLHRNYL